MHLGIDETLYCNIIFLEIESHSTDSYLDLSSLRQSAKFWLVMLPVHGATCSSVFFQFWNLIYSHIISQNSILENEGKHIPENTEMGLTE